MKAFRFRLDRVLELRRREEEGRARELGLALRAEAGCESARQGAERDLDRAQRQFADAQCSGRTAGELANLDHARDAAAMRVEDSAARLAEARERSAAERDRYAEARRERRRVEKLRERRAGEWQEESLREERRTMDDVAGRRATPRREP